ncbi:MAG: exopolysaccharide biosynthesis polyprenyl glycosylphosphotransferase [Acidobacteria bacterium]|nr:MAG: exopolysaccharide biosynthesis polyprenyl glycosylphosphotransferase [Acidobacteriota bacterium]
MNDTQVLANLSTIISHDPVDEVIVALPLRRRRALIEKIVEACEEQGIMVRVRTDLFDLRVARPQVDTIDGVPVVTIRSGPEEGWQLVLKRVIDFLGSAALLILLAPFLLLVALLVRLDSPGPVLFRQERVGLNRRRFKLIKFRTMVQEADKKQELFEALNEADGPVFKIRNDPRVTRLGRFLRQFSIDELPQLINVLKGEMSLVGPRPLPLRDVKLIDAQWHKRRFSVKPGLTCLWQVNGRSDVSFERWVRMDLEYIDTWSLALDLKILLKTIPVVFRGSGAY